MKQIKFNQETTFEGKTAVIICHDSTPGPPHNLADYLLKHSISKLVFIGHVNQFVVHNRFTKSYLRIYENGKLKTAKYGFEFKAPEPIRYIHDFFLSLFWVYLYCPERIDYFIGLGNLNAYCGIMLRNIHPISNIIYYVIDYVPQRFPNELINSLYHNLDRICARYANSTWNYGKNMIRARELRWKEKFPHQYHTPHGVVIDEKVLTSSLKYDKFKLIYMGSLIEQQGVQLVIEALPAILKELPKVTLDIIGSGPYREKLERLIAIKSVQSAVRFMNFIEDPHKVDILISKAALGIATYKNDIGFVQYTEPSKVRRYLACGIAVVITKGTPLSEEVQTSDCGIVCQYNVDETANNIISTLRNKKKMENMRKNGIAYAKKYTWEKIYTEALGLRV